MRVFKDDYDPEMLARTWVALEKRGRNPEHVLKCPRPPEELIEQARKQIDALDKAKAESLPPLVKVIGAGDLAFKVLLDGRYCGRVEMDPRTQHWLSVDRDYKLKVFSARQDAVDYLTIEEKAAQTALRKRKILGS